MKKTPTFSDVFAAAGKLPVDDMVKISEILHKRVIKIRRKELALDIKSARAELKSGRVKKCPTLQQDWKGGLSRFRRKFTSLELQKKALEWRQTSKSQPTGVINFSVFRHDDEIEAIYIKLREGKVSKSKEIGAYGEAVVDLDKNGNAVGIEMLEPGRVTVKLVKKIKKEFNIRELGNFNIDRLQKAFS